MVKEYANEAIVVTWDAQRCIHTGICTSGLPGVFKVANRPWIQLEGAEAAAVQAVVNRCPTGALRSRMVAAEPAPPADPQVTIRAVRDGPLYVEGPVRVVGPDGVITEEDRFALCRCGATQRPPFCDNGHRRVGYRTPPASPGSAADSPADICRRQEYEV